MTKTEKNPCLMEPAGVLALVLEGFLPRPQKCSSRLSTLEAPVTSKCRQLSLREAAAQSSICILPTILERRIPNAIEVPDHVWARGGITAL